MLALYTPVRIHVDADDHHDISAIAASPADPSVLYLGLVVEEVSVSQ